MNASAKRSSRSCSCGRAPTVTGADVRAFAAETVARFKAPRAVLLCDHIGRHPSGKADYGWAKQAARDAVAVTR